jgi:hypothetical protein
MVQTAAQLHESSYSQSGEDRIVAFAFNSLGIQKPTYLDIGAYNPKKLSNTFLFYERGFRGVCVEPNRELAAYIARKRPGDVVLNVGAGFTDAHEQDLFLLETETLSTFSKAESERMVELGYPVKAVEKIPLMPINDLLARFDPWPNFVSLDAEGMDFDLLRAIDFTRFRPEVICVETVEFETGEHDPAIAEFLVSKGHRVYAMTPVNTIFVNRGAWERRPRHWPGKKLRTEQP